MLDLNGIIQTIAVYALPVIFALSLHEAAHAYIAHKYGDDTAKVLGRLSINPIRHIDPIGTVLFPLIGIAFGGIIFGWAKPVPINFSKLHNPKRNLFWIAFAGPISNLVQALVWALLMKLSFYLDSYFGTPLRAMAQAGVIINITFMLINLIPILPLDGGRMLFSLLPEDKAYRYSKTEPYGMWILMILFLTKLLGVILGPPLIFMVSGIFALIQN